MIGGRRKREGLDFSFAAINIVLLLLFYFIVTGTVSNPNEYSFQAPVTTDLPLTRLPRPLLAIDQTGTRRLDGVEVTQDRLAAALVDLRKAMQDPSRPLHILAARDGPATELLEAAQLASAAGFDVRVVTQPEERQGP